MSAPALPPNWVTETLEGVAEVHDDLREPVNAEERKGRVGPYPYYGATGQVGWRSPRWRANPTFWHMPRWRPPISPSQQLS